ncbi:DUF6701 domain-containing protein [Duganella sp. BuS-21]|uniref:DUF6701 domain-containing protein n=1 Tax=Duganella sp. BuS-21 TaxID=2943848 RepID=UPI0035A67F13
MKSIFGWLIVLTTLMTAAPASAANVNFNGGAVANCPLSASTYNCTGSFAIGPTDVVVIAGGYTVVMTSFAPSYNQGLTISATGALQTSGNLDLSGINPASVSTGGSTLTAGGSFKLGSSVTINGSIVAASISTNSGVTITGSVNVSGLADLGSAIKVNGNVTANAVQTNSPGTIGGAITATTTVAMGSGLTVGGNVSGTTITSTSPVTVNGNVTASTSFTLASGSTVNGNVTSPVVTLSPSSSTVKGNITASTSLDIGSGNTVTGTVKGGSLTMRASGAVINGSVTMTGDVDMGSGTTINGDLSARNVNTHSSNATVNGNAAVNAIYLDWGAAVTKTITCTGPGAVGCSCVTKADSSYNPTCGSPPPSLPHHFQISHSGTALTCQPQTVTVTACANAACTAPHYTGNVEATLQPGGKAFAISGGVNTAATVENKTPGISTLSASGATNASTCINSGNGAACAMDFKTTGLKVSGTNHISMKPGVLVTVEALTASAGNQSCVPLVASQTVDVDMSCKFSNPASARTDAPVKMGTRSATCGQGVDGSAVSVPFTFNAAGLATVALEYAEVGLVGLNASITKPSYTASGSGSFMAAPATLLLKATSAAGTIIGPTALSAAPTAFFAKASENFTLSVIARNYAGVDTVNFGKESAPPAFNMTFTVNPGEATLTNGLPTFGAFSYSTLHKAPSASASFSDVGAIKLTPALVGDYYLNHQIAAFKPAVESQFIGRFIPDHFDTVLVPNTEITGTLGRSMDCVVNGTPLADGVNPCYAATASGTVIRTGSFINSVQPFYVKVLAYNGASTPALTTNYAGALSRRVTLSAHQAKGSLAAANGTLAWSDKTAGATTFTFPIDSTTKIGTATGTLTAANLPSFTLPSAYPTPPDLIPVLIYLRATDTDGATSKRSIASDSVEAALTVVSGRLLVANAHGSPTAPLPVSVSAQYYVPGGYVFNPQVEGTSSDAVSVKFGYANCQNKLKKPDGSCATVDLANTTAKLTVTKGKGSFRLAAPVPTLTGIGSAEVHLNKPNTPLSDLIPGLPSTSGRATFGVYRSGPVIYTREVY